jgi:hypothetical protein
MATDDTLTPDQHQPDRPHGVALHITTRRLVCTISESTPGAHEAMLARMLAVAAREPRPQPPSAEEPAS